MKRILCLVLSAILMLAVFAGCSNSSNDTTGDTGTESANNDETANAGNEGEEESTDEAPEPATNDDMPVATGVDGLSIGICIYEFSDNFMTLYRNELQRYLEGGGASVQIMDGKNDQSEQTNQIQNFITQGVDVLIVNLVQASAAPTITDMCDEAGIPVVFINREPDQDELDRWTANDIKATYVGADASQSGTFQGEIIAELADNGDINGDGTVAYAMIQGDTENIDAQMRTEFSIKALEDAGITVNNLFQDRGDWDQARGQELAANALTMHGDDLEVIFCNNDAMAMGALQAIEAAGRTVNEDIYLVGVDALAEALEAINDDRMTGTVFNDHFSQARSAADRASEFANDATVEIKYVVDYVKVTPANAGEVLALVS